MVANPARVARVAVRILNYVAEQGLPAPDFDGGPSFEDTIGSLLKNEELTEDECFEFLKCSEHVDPGLEEHFALRRMKVIITEARRRRGVPEDRMNDAVSL